jgi:hypothetical protein
VGVICAGGAYRGCRSGQGKFQGTFAAVQGTFFPIQGTFTAFHVSANIWLCSGNMAGAPDAVGVPATVGFV